VSVRYAERQEIEETAAAASLLECAHRKEPLHLVHKYFMPKPFKSILS